MNWGAFFLDHTVQLLIMAILLLGSAFFSGSETALFSLTAGEIHRMRHGDNRLGHLIASLLSAPQRLLNTILMGNMLVNVAYSAIAALMILDLKAYGAAAWTTAGGSLVPLLVLILVGEVSPKMLAWVVGRRWAEAVALPLSLLSKVLGPVLWAIDTAVVVPLTRLISPRRWATADVTADEMEALLHLSAKRGAISHDARQLLQEIVELTEIRVSDVMVPRVDMVAFDIDGSSAELLELFRTTRLRRIPIYRGDVDNVLGVVHAKRLLLNPDAPIAELITEVPFVPESANLERVLLRFRRDRGQFAIVVDEYGGTAGQITLQEVLEEIVGDIPDPHDAAPVPTVERVGEREYLVSGDLSIHEWTEAFKVDLAERDVSTVGGLVTSLLGHIPTAGESARYLNLRFTVESMRRRRVERVRLELLGGET